MIDKSEVEHIAKLARLELNQEEKEKYQNQLGDILDYVKKLQEVETDGIETADGGTRDLENVWRDDKAQNSINNKQGLINMAPEKEDNQIKVKSVF